MSLCCQCEPSFTRIPWLQCVIKGVYEGWNADAIKQITKAWFPYDLPDRPSCLNCLQKLCRRRGKICAIRCFHSIVSIVHEVENGWSFLEPIAKPFGANLKNGGIQSKNTASTLLPVSLCTFTSQKSQKRLDMPVQTSGSQNVPEEQGVMRVSYTRSRALTSRRGALLQINYCLAHFHDLAYCCDYYNELLSTKVLSTL